MGTDIEIGILGNDNLDIRLISQTLERMDKHPHMLSKSGVIARGQSFD
jgi:hypothetical protein